MTNWPLPEIGPLQVSAAVADVDAAIAEEHEVAVDRRAGRSGARASHRPAIDDDIARSAEVGVGVEPQNAAGDLRARERVFWSRERHLAFARLG